MPSTRRQRAAAASVAAPEPNDSSDDDDDDEEEDDEEEMPTFTFQGKTYATYELMVQAKRERNREVLRSTGLLGASTALRDDVRARKAAASATKRGIKSDRKRKADVSLPRRSSSRLRGVKADGSYVEDERAGRFTIAGEGSTDTARADAEDDAGEQRYFNDRINDGTVLSVKEAAELPGPKWVKDATVPAAEKFMGQVLASVVEEWSGGGTASSPTSVASLKAGRRSGSSSKVASLTAQVDALRVEDEDCVSKVVPDRIYAIACHPSPSSLIVCAGDKQGHVGIWNVDRRSEEEADDEQTANGGTDGVHLFKPHSRVVTHMEWNRTGTSLLTASYDGSVRMFDVQSQKFDEIFATYDDSSDFKGRLGYGCDTGYNYWTQYACLDHRSADDRCLFLSTSKGTVMHVDLRSRGKITFHQDLSEKKINSVSLHPDGHILATAGLDTTVKLWDIRKFQSSSKQSTKPYEPTTGSKPIATQFAGKSVNSAFFSPSGKSLLSTTMDNYLDLTSNIHTQKGTVKVDEKIRHDNHTGRWLSTFMARWHPNGATTGASRSGEELFVVGSMRRPRTMEVFEYGGSGSEGGGGKMLGGGIQGERLTAVVSRCCFHPGEERLIVVGGNSSGRVTIAR